ncbi:superoxide dismutase [Micromonospora sp. WMMD882]|uniref:superoxide dismutase n=1 Tax=Micromonospora sp. WMMD882 TaxID=3015151 RepID=UPI00248CBEE2|nr:superoxide dismutase [Micromonospora sp. WMMD882]WBB80148.1 superoxide dismutase [Micromonospora sp. WMMD882]
MTGADPMAAFTAAQQAAGVVAARHRGDLAGAEELLAGFPDEGARVRGFCLLAELSLSLVRSQTGQTMDELVQELTLLMASATDVGPPPGPAR